MPENEITEITYSVNAPFSNSSLIFYSNGRIEYNGRSEGVADAKKEKSSGKITLSQFKEMAELIESSGFFAWENKYSVQGLSDGITYSITVKKGSQTKTVSCYGDWPKGFTEIEEKIKELWPAQLLHEGF
jgi:hypothetical protein